MIKVLLHFQMISKSKVIPLQRYYLVFDQNLIQIKLNLFFKTVTIKCLLLIIKLK